MRKWTVRLCVSLFFVLLIAATLYECSTHIVRGWLRGEAFFEGRPTSYWRGRCDEWLDGFDDDFDLQVTTWLIPFEYPEDPSLRRLGFTQEMLQRQQGTKGPLLPPPTFWARMRDSMRSKADLERERMYEHSPAILRGSLDTQAVLEELAVEEKYQMLANLGLKRVAQIRVHYEQFKKEMAIP